MSLRPQPTVVPLEAEDVVALQEILVDRDAEAALEFLRTVVAEKVRRRQEDSHRPPFEGGIRIERTPGFFTEETD
jgi:hypothetical protein